MRLLQFEKDWLLGVQILHLILCFILWFVMVPAFAGIIPSYILNTKQKNIGTTYLLGWMIMWSAFQVLAVPFIVEGKAFSLLCKYFMLLMLGIVVLGIILIVIDIGRDDTGKIFEFNSIKNMDKNNIAIWILFFAIVLFQLIMSVCYMTYDGDDSYYLTQALLSVKTDTMFRIDAYTGVITSPDYRHYMSPFSMFIGFFSVRAKVHPLIAAHIVFPLVLIPLTYLVFYKIGVCLFDKHREKVSVFMVLAACIMVFGAASPYTTETFFLTRTWQGKAVLASMIIPMIFWLMLLMAGKTDDFKNYPFRMGGIFLALAFTNIAGCLTSSVWLAIMPIMEMTLVLIISCRNKRFKLIPATVASMLPCYVYPLLFLVFRG